jgi:hypothetical protein
MSTVKVGNISSVVLAWFRMQIFLPKICYLFNSLHHITLDTLKDMFGAANVGKKITNYTILLYITSRIF